MMSHSDTRKAPRNGGNLACSFCGKEHRQVEQLVAGPGGVAICTECVDLCNEIIADSRAAGPMPPRRPGHPAPDDQ